MFFRRPANKSRRLVKSLVQTGLVVLAVLLPLLVFAEVTVNPQRSEEQLREDAAIAFWLSVNEARRDPLAVAARLGLDETAVRAALGDRQWILDRGLAPLAWNNSLYASARNHGRDMLARDYYSYVTPEGLTSGERVAATGYQAVSVGESMNALYLENFVSLDMAVGFLLDAMLEDELTGSPSARGNFFAPEKTELGVAFFAESLVENGKTTPVYLVVVDFAEPLEMRRFLIGRFDVDAIPFIRPLTGSRWYYMPYQRPGLFQMPYPESGADFVVVSHRIAGKVGPVVAVYGNSFVGNGSIDLRVRPGS